MSSATCSARRNSSMMMEDNAEFRRQYDRDRDEDDEEHDEEDGDEDEEELVRGHLDEIKQSLVIAERLAQASLMTPASAKRRLAARSVELGYTDVTSGAGGYVPPKQLLIYLVRMGSFNSAPKILNDDCQDRDVIMPQGISRQELLQICQQPALPPMLKRRFRKAKEYADKYYGHRTQIYSSLIKENREFLTNPYNLRVLQWNILSQVLGQMIDNFARCPEKALEWHSRRYQIVEEIVEYCPDVICLQEVDHFNFIKNVLDTQGYTGLFFPKPDSPCIYVDNNNGPDGCAIFYRRDKYELLRSETRILEVWRVQSNQVALLLILKVRETGQEICVATTHLKARNSALMSTLRNEQGRDLLEFVASNGGNRPTILCGDFNAEPIEPVYDTILGHQGLKLGSAYADMDKSEESSGKREPPYTTWKIRDEGEICHTIDYVFYTKNKMSVEDVLEFPTGEEMGADRVPSFRYPSDHFSLACDFKLNPNASML